MALHRIGSALLLALALSASPAGAEEQLLAPPEAAGEIRCPEGTSLRERTEGAVRDAWCARPGGGVLHGPYRSWHANGQLRSSTRYVDGLEHGVLRAWHPDGSPALEAHLVHGTLEGHWTEWHPNGQVAVRARFAGGEPTGTATWWYEDGTRRLEGDFRGFANDGVWTTWWPNGARRRECTWSDGRLEGPCRGWDEQGGERFAVRYVAPRRGRKWSYWRSNGELQGFETESAWVPLDAPLLPANAESPDGAASPTRGRDR